MAQDQCHVNYQVRAPATACGCFKMVNSLLHSHIIKGELYVHEIARVSR